MHYLLEQMTTEILFCMLSWDTHMASQSTAPAFYKASLFKCHVLCSLLEDYSEQVSVQNHTAYALLKLTSLICIFELNL